jgi:DNA-binding transcriptional regulator YdaS (Cro superfamily)
MSDDDIFDAWEQELIWLIGKTGGVNALARELQVSSASVSYWLRRKRKPSHQQALNIEAYTQGRIRRETIRPDIYPASVLLPDGARPDMEGFNKKPFERTENETNS